MKTGLPTPLVCIALQDVALADNLIKNGIHMWFLNLRVEESKQPATVAVLQCFNCEKFGHASAACKASTRCVRCSGMHAVKACPKNREETCCANCRGPHAASYRGCPKYSQVIALKREKFLNASETSILSEIKSLILKNNSVAASSKAVKPTTQEKVKRPQPATSSAPVPPPLKRTYAEATARRRETVQSTQTHRLLISLGNNNIPTHTHHDGNQDILDRVLFTSNISPHIQDFTVLPDIGSDHYPISVTLNIADTQTSNSLPYLFDFSATNWHSFWEFLDPNLPPVITHANDLDTIDKYLLQITDAITEAIQKIVPKRRINNNPNSWKLTREIRTLITKRRRLRRQFITSRNPMIKTEINRVTSLIKRRINEQREQNWNEFCDSLDKSYKDPATFWKKFRSEDGIRNIILKKASPLFLKHLTAFFNISFYSGYYPPQCKSAIIKVISKTNPASSNPKDYRPISLLNNIGKLLEKVLANRISCLSANHKTTNSTTNMDRLNTLTSNTVKPTTQKQVQQPQPATTSAPSSRKRTYAEATVRSRETSKSKKTNKRLIISIVGNPWYLYFPSSTPDTNLLLHVVNSFPYSIIIGDLNSKHRNFSCRSINQNGLILNNFISQHDLILGNNNIPTHTHHDGTQDILDLSLYTTKISPYIQDFTVHHDIGSDHYPISVTLNGAYPQTPNTQPNLFDYSAANWNSFWEFLDRNLPPVITQANDTESIDDYLLHITNATTDAIYKIIPKRGIISYPNSWKLTREVHLLITKRCKLRRQFITSRNSMIKTQINRVTNLIKRRINEQRDQNWSEFCASLDNSYKDPATFWRKFKSICNDNSTNRIPNLKHNNSSATDDLEKANLLADYYKQVFATPNLPHFNHTHLGNIQNFIQNNITAFSSHFPSCLPHNSNVYTTALQKLIKPITPDEIKLIIKTLKGSAPGEDGIRNILKKASPSFLRHLTALFNLSFYSGYYPPSCKSAIIKVIHVPKTNPASSNPKDYRPISLINNIGKLLKKILATRITWYLESEELLSEIQNASRKNRQTADHLVPLTESVTQGFNRNHTTVGLFLDVKQAFDSVWHQGLKFKLLQFDLPPTLTRWIASFLDNRTAKVRINNATSHTVRLSAGVLQGSVLSPLLYILYVNDIPFPQLKYTHASQYAATISRYGPCHAIPSSPPRKSNPQ
ncbi:uncharacterized protein LOC143232530 [Tachypleus tridentatus]|uniref:uncharacterized protein LOC143232530 n=1 Tax=Tachypleus tridentatus TaxID=6853 RepID=UPI003FCF112A